MVAIDERRRLVASLPEKWRNSTLIIFRFQGLWRLSAAERQYGLIFETILLQ